MLSAYSLSDSTKFKHYQHRLLSLPDLQEFNEDNMDVFELAKDEATFLKTMLRMFTLIAQNMYDDEVVQELYEKRNDFDLFIIDGLFNEVS